MAKPPGKPKKPKDAAKPTRAKAARPVEPATPDALADLLNPAINKGTAGLGSGTGLTSFTSPQGGEVDPSEARSGEGERTYRVHLPPHPRLRRDLSPEGRG